jgi:hypothetical protein
MADKMLLTVRSFVHVVRVSLLASTTSQSTSARVPRFRADWAGMTRKPGWSACYIWQALPNNSRAWTGASGDENLLLLWAASTFTANTSKWPVEHTFMLHFCHHEGEGFRRFPVGCEAFLSLLSKKKVHTCDWVSLIPSSGTLGRNKVP